MKITYRKLNEAEPALRAFYSQPQEYEFRILLMRQAEELWKAISACKKFHAELREVHMTQQAGQDKPMVNSKEAADALNAAWAEFLDRKIALEVPMITEEMLRGVSISPLDHMELNRLFSSVEAS